MRRAKGLTHSLPWRCGLLHYRIFLWRLMTDMVQPRMPFWRDLRSVPFVLVKVDPAVTA